MPTTRCRRHFRFVLDSLAATRAFTSATLRHEGGRRGRRRDPSLKASAKETILRAEWYRRGPGTAFKAAFVCATPRTFSHTHSRRSRCILKLAISTLETKKRRADGGGDTNAGERIGAVTDRRGAIRPIEIRLPFCRRFEVISNLNSRRLTRRIATITRRSPMEAWKRPASPLRKNELS
jgi:hypothetical protein